MALPCWSFLQLQGFLTLGQPLDDTLPELGVGRAKVSGQPEPNR